jgi:hypothetical protein
MGPHESYSNCGTAFSTRVNAPPTSMSKELDAITSMSYYERLCRRESLAAVVGANDSVTTGSSITTNNNNNKPPHAHVSPRVHASSHRTSIVEGVAITRETGIDRQFLLARKHGV